MSKIQTPSDIQSLMVRAATVAQLLSIADISLETNNKGTMIRGFSSTHGAPVLISHMVDDQLPFQSFAINDCKAFMAKYKLAESQDERFDSQMEVDDTTKKVSTVVFKKSKGGSGARFTLQFNTGNADTVRAPKGVKDNVVFSFPIDKDHATTINKSIKAMRGETVTLIYDGEELSYEIKASAKDIFTSVLTTTDEAGDSFAYSYPFATLYPALQHNDTQVFNITSRGLLNCQLYGINIFIFPKV